MIRTFLLPAAAASILALSAPASAQTGGGGTGARRPQPATNTTQSPRAAGGSATARQVPQGFSVVLVLGDLHGGATSDNVPAAARKALADMKDFLPYKSYRLLDVQWTLCCSRGPNTSVVSRLRGADGQDYELSLSTSIDGRDRLGVRFLLREPTTDTAHVEGTSELIVQLQRETRRLQDELDAATKKAKARSDVGMGGPVEENRNLQQLRDKVGQMKIRLAEARRERQTTGQSRSLKAAGNRAVIDTSFTMDVGETVVVGTSRVAGGEKALIALLTAVAQNPSNR